jgi:hypothetical protein
MILGLLPRRSYCPESGRKRDVNDPRAVGTEWFAGAHGADFGAICECPY